MSSFPFSSSLSSHHHHFPTFFLLFSWEKCANCVYCFLISWEATKERLVCMKLPVYSVPVYFSATEAENNTHLKLLRALFTGLMVPLENVDTLTRNVRRTQPSFLIPGYHFSPYSHKTWLLAFSSFSPFSPHFLLTNSSPTFCSHFQFHRATHTHHAINMINCKTLLFCDITKK